jgi:hypothetical protein
VQVIGRSNNATRYKLTSSATPVTPMTPVAPSSGSSNDSGSGGGEGTINNPINLGTLTGSPVTCLNDSAGSIVNGTNKYYKFQLSQLTALNITQNYPC